MKNMDYTNMDKLAVNALKALSIDAIEVAKSGHPGLPLGAAAFAYELYARHLKFNPQNPDFFDRDRFVLSAGHGSALLYSLLHLFGFDLSMDDLKRFRHAGSKTPGHPERGVTPGVDCSTGPLGQGLANAVGFALAESILAARFNKKDFPVVDHYTYALCGEGCLMEGIGYEAAALAGEWGLGKLIVLHDSNLVTIEGKLDSSFSQSAGDWHKALDWQVLRVSDGSDLKQISEAICEAKKEKDKPSLIIISTKIGWDSPLEGCASCHGAPLGEDKIQLTKNKIGWTHPPFSVPAELYQHFKQLTEKGEAAERQWNETLERYRIAEPDLYRQFNEALAFNRKFDFTEAYKQFSAQAGDMATRKASGIVLNKIADSLLEFLGGSADLGPSNLTVLNDKGVYSRKNRLGRNINYGVREHAMAAVTNGLALHGGIKPFCATFFAFSDYMKNAVRMSALMSLPVIYVFTHDSIGVGEDGPTHQPIEHLAGLRAMPGLKVFRPADAIETAAAYESALSENMPACVIASRQDLPILSVLNAGLIEKYGEGFYGTGREALRGGYIIYQSPIGTNALILSSGSEVHLSIEAAKILESEGIGARVVSMVCFSEFDKQSDDYKNEVLPIEVRARVAVEAASRHAWGKYIGLDGDYICIDRFGESAKPADLFKKYKITALDIVERVKSVVKL